LVRGKRAILAGGKRTAQQSDDIAQMRRLLSIWAMISGGGVVSGVDTERVLGMWGDLFAPAPKLARVWFLWLARNATDVATLDLEPVGKEISELPMEAIDFILQRYPGSSAVRQTGEIVEEVLE